MSRISVALCLAVVSCGAVDPPILVDELSEPGYKPFTDIELIEMYSYAAVAFGHKSGLKISADRAAEIWSRMWSITWTKAPFECHLPGKDTCIGLQGTFKDAPKPAYWVIIMAEKCITSTSFAHELMHIFSKEMFGTYDPEHENHLLFGEGLAERSAVELAQSWAEAEGMCEVAK